MKTATKQNGEKHKLVNVLMPVELIEVIDSVRNRVSRADWIRDACMARIPSGRRPDCDMPSPGNPTGKNC